MISKLVGHLIDIKFLNYLKFGVLNTLASLIIIYTLIFFGNDPYLSNLIGYVYGVFQSFYLNKTYVFSINKVLFSHYKGFLIAFLVSYTINAIFLWVMLDILLINTYLAQFLCMGIYAVVFFLMLKMRVYVE
jgi:putative flippase GtrA